jgi:starch-binding outer membrane protein, SusD/RagB family
MRALHSARWAVASGAAIIAIVAGCDWKDTLLEPQNPGLIDESAVSTPAGALALKVGAMGRLKLLVNCGGGECLWEEGGHLADEFKNSDFQPTRQDVDMRSITTSNGTLSYNTATTIRGYLRTAINKMTELSPTSTADIAELWMALGFVEMSLAETYCNGIPLGILVNGVADYSSPAFKPLTNQEVYTVALSHLDSALTILGTATDVASTDVRRASLVVKARILVNQGQFAAAAALVPPSAVSSTPGATYFQYMFTTQASSNADDLGIWQVNNNVARLTVSDSFDIIGGAQNVIANALPFARGTDPRVPVILETSHPAEDGSTPLYTQQIWRNRDDPIPMVSGIDARLIEAEARLNASDIPGMMTILNALRTAPPRIGNFQPAAMAALATPGTQAAATTLFFREKAFWTFGRGQRLGDLRRLIRQYGRPEAQVFPKGNYYKGGVYGTDVNFPVPDGELVNPQFTGCIDRNA